MNLSNFWPRAGAGKSATPVVSVSVSKRAGAGHPVATGNTPKLAEPHPRLVGPRELPDTLEACEALHEQLVADAIRLELSLAQAVERAIQGTPYDRAWYNRAKAALKHLNHDRTRLLYRCGQLRKEAKAHAQQHMDRVILDVIKESMPADQFLGFVRIAEARMASGVTQ
ncbi:MULTISPECIES: hypothetical protein [Pseudomonas]|uniref:hypothetical protein n=1 Tax=Pseudomonas TaxID=286 RepID=UPI0002A173A3|nr:MULTISPECIES: hypothetical protein [Pseudomonas]AGA74910.1 hypothetical protein B479_20090 [Pseudomonas putida HB3267]MCE0757492.1 hypothetical protein [Pseudomonas asiatica]MCE0945893.1 hypothetical protein [Pseudomonas asiatica]MCE1033123.1 hypothetical protein [Pseudomonas asiatica]MCE1066849.1 hypothetical protein [Pseudomonas asiatica]